MDQSVGYARSGPGLPGLAEQVERLRRVGCRVIRRDRAVVSGKTPKALFALAGQLGFGDRVVVASLAVLADTKAGVSQAISRLAKNGVRLISLSEGIGPGSRQSASIAGTTADDAQASLDTAVVRTVGRQPGSTATGVDGVPSSGRRSALDACDLQRARSLMEGGASLRATAGILEIPNTTLQRTLNRTHAN